MKTKIFLFLAGVLIMTACKTGSNFTSRRYMAGHYKANHNTVKKPETLVAKNNDNALKKQVYEKLYTTIDQSSSLIASKTINKSDFIKKTHKVLDFKKGVSKAKENKMIKNSFANVKNLFGKKDKSLKSAKNEGELSTKSLIGFSCGVGGIAIDVIAFIVAVASLSYGVLALMFVGLALGIVGIIFGTQGIKDYRESRHTPTLVFGIIGAATGLAAIILAIYLGIYGALLIAVNAI